MRGLERRGEDDTPAAPSIITPPQFSPRRFSLPSPSDLATMVELKNLKHTLQACWVFLNVRAEIRACKERGIQRISPTRHVYCLIHKTKNHNLSSCKVFLSTTKTSSPKVQQSGISLRDEDKEQGTLVSDRFVGVIDIDSHVPSVLHLLEDYGSSPMSTSSELLAINGTSKSAHANAEAENQVTTPAQHIRTLNTILRETPYDPVLNDDLARWQERLRESVTNLSHAFEEAAAATHQEQPPTGGVNGKNPEQRESPPRATPPPRGTGDLCDHLNGRREARRTRDDGNRSRHRVSSRHRDNEDRDRTNRHNRHDHDDCERRTQGDTGRGCRYNDEDDRDRRRDNNGGRRQDSREPSRRPRTYKRHAIEDDLHALTQNSGESLREYVWRFNECRNTIPEITDASVIRAFKSGVRDHYTTQELATRRIRTTRRLFEIVERCAHVDDALRRKNDKPKTGGEKKPATDAPESSKKKNRKSGKRKAQAEVLAAEYANPPKRCRDRENCLFPNASVLIPVPGKAGVHHTNMI
uniref:OSJNBa0034E24.17 protein n=1 Tax=Oryza sativa subsp. japonica TaxID=39947 RepID=Q7XJZ4_ORYSJ|nr:OSJNBa0034E24.17 [Oryza sativa Japonica Group]